MKELGSEWQAVDYGAAWIMVWIAPGQKLAVKCEERDQGVNLNSHPAATLSSDFGFLQSYFSTWTSALQSYVHDRSLLFSLCFAQF